jgi:hypothetical protein
MNADERRSSERAAGWCRPGGATASAVCGICGSDSGCSLSEHGRAEWRFARSAGTGGFPRRPWCSPTGASGRLGGWLWRVGAGCRRRGCFSRNCATTLAPAGAGSSRRVRHGRGHDPAERQAQVTADVVFAKSRNDPPSGRTGTDRGGLGFCEIAQRPCQRKDGHSSRWAWFLRNRATTPASAGAGSSRRVRHGRGHDRGRAGTGHGRHGFAKLRNDPGLRRGRLPPPGSARAGARPGERRAQVAADVVFAKLRNDPPAGAGSSRRARHGRVFAKCATTLGWGAPSVCAMQRSGTGMAAATTGLGLRGRAPSPGSLRDPTLVRSSRPKPARGRGEHGSR